MPFSSEFATGSALDITDKKLDELTLSVSGVNYHLTEVESSRPTRDEIHAISGHYASHDEVQEWAGKASALAIDASQETLDNTATQIRNSISALDDNCRRWDAVVLKTAEEYSSANLMHVSAFLDSKFDKRVDTEISDRKAAVSGEFDRASGEEYRIETKFDGLCATLSADLSAVSAISKAEDARIDRRIDSYQQVFSAALDSISATAMHADEERQFNNFISDAGIHYSSAAHTMYLGHEKVVDLSVSGDLKTSGNLNTVDIKARDIEANDIGMRSLAANDIEVTAFVAGSGANKIEYEGGDTVSFGNAMFTVAQGNLNYSLDPAVSYKNGAVKLGNSVPHDPVSSISIGNGNADKNHSIVIATQDVTKANAVANGAGTINLYAENDENNVYIGTSSIPEIITKYAASKADLENEVREGIESTSGIIRSGIQHEVEQAVSADIRATELNLSAYVNEETQKRIDDVQSVRDELPFYLHTSGGIVWGDLIVKDLDVADTLYYGIRGSIAREFTTDGEKKVNAFVSMRGCTKTDLDYISSQEYADTVVVTSGSDEEHRVNIVYDAQDSKLQSFSPIKSVSFGSNVVIASCSYTGSESSLSSIVIPSSVGLIHPPTAFANLSALSSVTFSDKTKSQVSAMDGYPWGATPPTIFVCDDGNIDVFGSATPYTSPEPLEGGSCKVLYVEADVYYGYGRGYSLGVQGPVYLKSDGQIQMGETNPWFVIEKDGDDYALINSKVGEAIPWPDGTYHQAPIISATIGENTIDIAREGPTLKRNILGPEVFSAALKFYTPSEVLFKLAEHNSEPDTLYVSYSASGEWLERFDGEGVGHYITNQVSVPSIKLERMSSLSGNNIYYKSPSSMFSIGFNRNDQQTKRIDCMFAPVYQYTQDPEKIGTYAILPGAMDFYAGTGDLESLGQYLDEHNELTRYMYEVSMSAQRAATSAYSVAVSAYDTATEAHDLIVQAQGIVASASNTATSAYNIAMSAYALSGVLQEVADYLRDINGEG